MNNLETTKTQQLQPSENIKKLHENLNKTQGFNVPFDRFFQDMQDETKLQKVHGHLSKTIEGFNVPYDKFQSDMFGEQPAQAQSFNKFWNENPKVKEWRNEFKAEYGVEPSLDSDYDYRGAFEAGIVPERNEHDGGKYHWGSIGLNGKDLKSKNHPTRWKSEYMKLSGVNPDEKNIDIKTAIKQYPELSEFTPQKETTPDINTWVPGATGIPMPTNPMAEVRGVGRAAVSGTVAAGREMGLALKDQSLKLNSFLKRISDNKGWQDYLAKEDERLEGNIENIKKWGKNLPELQGGAGEFIGGMVPFAGMAVATALTRSPALATATTGMFAEMGYGSGLEAYDNYKKEKGEPIDEGERTGAALLYGAAMSVPMGNYLSKLVPKGVINKAIGKSVISNPEVAGKAGKEIFEAFAKQKPKLAKQFLDNVKHGVITMESMQLTMKAVDDVVIGQDVTFGDYLKTAAHAAGSGVVFSFMTAPFAIPASMKANRQRWEKQGEVTVTLGKDGQAVEVFPVGKDGKQQGMTPDGKIVEVSSEMVEKSFTMPSKVFLEGLDHYSKTGAAPEGFERNTYSERIKQYASRLANKGGFITTVKSAEGETGYYAGNGKEPGTSAIINKAGEIVEVPTESLKGMEMKDISVSEFHDAMMEKYDNPTGAKESSNPELQAGEQATPLTEPTTPKEQYQVKKQEWEQSSGEMADMLVHENGSYVNVEDLQGNQLFIKKGDLDSKTGLWVVKMETDENGQPVVSEQEHIGVSEINQKSIRNIENKEVFMQNRMELFEMAIEQELLPNVGDPVEYQTQDSEAPEQYIIAGEEGDNFLLLQDGKKEPIIVPKEEFKQPHPMAEQTPVPEAEQPQTTPIITEQIGKNSYNFTENEDGSLNLVPDEGQDMGKSLSSLEKEFKENPKWEVVAEKEIVEVPAQSRFSEPTQQTVIKSVRVQQRQQAQAPENTEQQTPGTKAEPVYTIDNQPIERQQAQDLITMAGMMKKPDKIKNLNIENDEELTALRDKYFPPAKPKYQLGNKEITAEQARMAVEWAETPDDLVKLKYANDNELRELVRAKEEQFKEKARLQQPGQTVEVPKLTPEQVTDRINSLIDQAKAYDAIPNNHTSKKSEASKKIQTLANQIGYKVGNDTQGNTTLFDSEGNPVQRKTAVKTPQEEIDAHPTLDQYENKDFKIVVAEITSSIDNFNGMDVAGLSRGEVESAIKNIQAGKATVAANKLLDALEGMINEGVIHFKADGRIGMPSMDMNLVEYVNFIRNISELSEAEQAAAYYIPEDIAEAIINYDETLDYNQLFNDYLIPNEKSSITETTPGNENSETKSIVEGNGTEKTSGKTATITEQSEGKLTESVNNSSNTLDKVPETPVNEADNQSTKDLVTPESSQKEKPTTNAGEQKMKLNRIIDEQEPLIIPLNLITPTKGHTKENTIDKHTPRNINEPIRVSVDNEGKIHIEDGNHRYFTAIERGDNSIKVVFGTQMNRYERENVISILPQLLSKQDETSKSNDGKGNSKDVLPVNGSGKENENTQPGLPDNSKGQRVNNSDKSKPELENTNIPLFSNLEKAEKRVNNKSAIKKAEKEVDTNPSKAQIEAGNYKKGHVKVNGFDLAIENPKGSTRSGTDDSGKKWSVTLNNSYGYYKRTNGTEGNGEKIDVFLGPNTESDKFFIVDQINDDGSFDEHKIMQGFNSKEEAEKAYLSNYSEGWKGLGAISELTKDEFSKWLKQNETGTRAKRKPVSELVSVKKVSPIEQAQKELTKLKNNLQAKEKEINERNSLFGDNAVEKGGLFEAENFDLPNAKKVVDGIKAEISRKEKEIEVLSKAAETGAKENEGQKEIVVPEEKPIVDVGKIISSSSRFRPKEAITFTTPLVGPSGAKLTGYEWKYDWSIKDGKDEGTIDVRVSDWTRAEQSADTGRDIVHQFTVEMPDGSTKTVSSESVLVLLGLTERNQLKSFPSLVNAVKTLAKQQMQLAILKDQLDVSKKAEAEVAKMKRPPIERIEQPDKRGGKMLIWKMGDAQVWDNIENKEIGEERKRALDSGWTTDRLKELGLGNYSNTSGVIGYKVRELKTRIERQQRKINQLTEKENIEHATTASQKNSALSGSLLPSEMSEEQYSDYIKQQEKELIIERHDILSKASEVYQKEYPRTRESSDRIRDYIKQATQGKILFQFREQWEENQRKQNALEYDYRSMLAKAKAKQQNNNSELSSNAKNELRIIKEAGEITVDNTRPSSDQSKAVKELLEKGLIEKKETVNGAFDIYVPAGIKPVLPKKGDTVIVPLGGRDVKIPFDMLTVQKNGSITFDHFGMKTAKPGEYTVIKAESKPNQEPFKTPLEKNLDKAEKRITTTQERIASSSAKHTLSQIEENGSIWVNDPEPIVKKINKYTDKEVVFDKENNVIKLKPTVTDKTEVQKIKNSIDEGQGILKSGKTTAGEYHSQESLEGVRKAVINSKKKIGDTSPTPKAEFKGKIKPQDQPVTWVPDDISYQLAYDAYSGSSFSPEKRAKYEQSSFVNSMNEVYETLSKVAKSPEQIKVMWEQLADYKDGFLKRKNALLSAESRTLSSMITGPANFPTRRNQKALGVVDKRRSEFLDWIEKAEKRAIKAIKNAASQEQKEDEAWQSIKKHITETAATIISIDKGIEKGLSRPLFVNSLSGFIKRMFSNGQYEHVIKTIDYLTEINSKYDKPVLSSRSKIWQLKQQSEEALKNKAEAPEADTGSETIYQTDDVEVVNNKELERVQISNTDIPPVEIRTKLKSAGFRWSPKNKAWQRKNTPEGIRIAQQFVEENYPKAKEGKAKPVQETPVKEWEKTTANILKNENVSAEYETYLKAEELENSLDNARDFLDNEKSIIIREDGLIEVDYLDEDTLPIIGDNEVVLNHFTSSEFVPEILKNGLTRRNDIDISRQGKESAGVYLTLRSSGADIDGYKNNIIQKTKGEPVRLEIKAKPSELNSDPDDADIQSGAYQYILSEVKPENIVNRKELQETAKEELQLKSPESKPVEKINDFGEKIAGAKKDIYSTLQGTTIEDIASMPLSKSFPKPDFAQLVKDGIITKEGALITKFLYDNIPSKPRKKYRVAGWAKIVQSAIDTYSDLLSKEGMDQKWIEKLENSETYYSLKNQWKVFREVQEVFGFPETDLNTGAYEIKEFVGSVGDRISIVKGHYILQNFKTIKDAAEALKDKLQENKGKKKETKFNVYRDTKTNKYFIGKKGAKGVVRLIDGLSRDEARETFKNKKDQINELWNKLKVVPEERRNINRERIGTDYRKGKNVSPEQFGNEFGFRGVQFGNWVNNEERQSSLNRAYDALMDLSTAIGVSPKALSLNGELGLAFGARGSGGKNPAAAHYEDGQVVINLTKKHGAGSLAHEWWHGLDNYFSRKRGEKDKFLTEKPRQGVVLDGKNVIPDERVRKEMHDAFKNVVDAIRKSELPKRSEEIDQTRSKPYWSQMLEMTARSFENFIIEKLGASKEQNDYLANFKELSEWINGGDFTNDNFPYPLEKESPAINEAFQQFFDTIQEKEEDGKTMLFEPTEKYRNLGVNEKQQEYKSKDGKTVQYSLAFGDGDTASTSEVRKENDRSQNPSLRKLKPGEHSSVEMKYSLDKNFVFDGSNKIESTDDIAYLFRQLEDVAVENMFAALVDKNGKPTIVHLSMGGRAGTVIDLSMLADAVHRLDAEKIYLIHNHPSGALQPSGADHNIHNKAVRAFGDKVQEHVIINLTSGKYVTFRNNVHSVQERPTAAAGNETNYKTLKFDRRVFKESAVLPVKITSSDAVAKFVSSQRFTTGNKQSAVIMDRGNNIVAYLHIGDTDFSSYESVQKLTEELQAYVGRFGAKGIILSGRIDASDQFRIAVKRIKADLDDIDVALLDYVDVKAIGPHESMADNGLMEPQAPYGKPNKADYKLLPDYLEAVEKFNNYISSQKTTDMTKQEIVDLLKKAQIPFNKNKSFKWGSEYWTIAGQQYRIADHDKPSDQLYSGIDLRSFDELLNELKSREDIDLTDKTETEEQFRENAKKLLKTEEHPEYGTIYITPSNAKFDNIDNATSNMWRAHLKTNQQESNLPQTQTKAFKKWFSDSKVVDGEGKPLVVYHGSQAKDDFNIFKGSSDGGYYFTDNQTVSEDYGHQIKKVFLSIKNPVIIEAKGKEWQGEIADKIQDEIEYYVGENADNIDGIIVRNVIDPNSTENKGIEADIYIAFKGTQIKSATGNNGDFDPDNPNILKESKARYTKSNLFESLKNDPTATFRLNKKEGELYEKIENTPRKLETHYNHTLIKRQIKALQQGHKLGIADTKQLTKAIQGRIVEYAKANMPLGQAGQREVSQLLGMVKETTDPAKLVRVFYQIDDLTTGIQKRVRISQIDKILKTHRPKKVNGKPVGKLDPDVYLVLDKIREIRRLVKPEDIDNYVDSLTPIDQEGNPTTVDEEAVVLFTIFGNLKEKSQEEIDHAVSELVKIVAEGQLYYRDEMMALRDELSDLREKVIAKITGGKGTMSSQDYRSLDIEPKRSLTGNFMNRNQSFEWLMDIISKDKSEKTGQGWMQEHFGDLLNSATNEETQGHRKNIELLNEKAGEIFGKTGSKLAKALAKNGKRIEKSGVTWLRQDGKRIEIAISQNEAYKKWMEMQDPTLDGTFKNMGWDNTTLLQLEAFMTPKVMQWAKWQIEEFYPNYYKGVNEAFRTAYFVNLPNNPKYSPIKRDITDVGDKDDALLKNSKMMAGVGNASLKSRVSNINHLNLVDGDLVLARHIAEMEHFKAWVHPVKQLRSVFGSRKVQHTIKHEHGNDIRRIINEQINDFARGGIDRALVITTLDKVRRNFVTAELGLNYGLLPKQLVSSFTYMMDMPMGDYMAGMAKFLSNPLKAVNEIKHSELIQNRYVAGWTHEVESALKSTAPNAVAGAKSSMNQVRNVLMLPTKLGDRFAIYAGWVVYDYHKKEQLKTGASEEAAKAFAMNKFERIVSRSQQSASLKDTSQLQKGSIGKIFTMFHNSQQQYFRYESAAIRNLLKGRGSKAHNAKIIMVTHFLLPMLFQMVSNFFTDEDKETERNRVIRSALLGSWNGLLIAGDMVEYGIEKAFGERWGYSPSPLFGAGENLGVGLGKSIKGIKDLDLDTFVKGVDMMAHATSQLFTGLPYRPGKKLINDVKGLVSPDGSDPELNNEFNALLKKARKNNEQLEALYEKDKTLYKEKYKSSETINFDYALGTNKLIAKSKRRLKSYQKDGLKDEAKEEQLYINDLMKEAISKNKQP